MADLGAALELSALGLGLTATVALLAQLPPWFWNLGRFQALALVAFGFWTLTLARAERYGRLPGAWIVVLAVAFATRALLVPVPPSLSGDLYRYLWEGRVLLAGGDPWRQAPLDPALAPLRDAWVWPKVNHPELATIYPPLAEAGYALVAFLSPTVLAFKCWIALHDFALVAVLLAWARRAGANPVAIAAYAWNPLVLIEYAGTGHHDPTALLWLAVAFLLAGSRPVPAALALAAATLIKPGPLIAAPFLMRHWPWRARIAAAVPIVLGLGWFLLHGAGERSGLGAFWSRWENNDVLFVWLRRALGGYAAARSAALAILLLLLVRGWRLGWDAARATRFGFQAGALLSPVLHPWYLGWVLVFEPFARSAFWRTLSATVLLSYGTFATPAAGRAYHLPGSGRALEYGLALAAALAAFALDRRANASRPRIHSHVP